MLNTKVKKVRDYQQGAIEACLPSDMNKGKVILPTGSGKTFIAQEIIEEIAKKTPQRVFSVFVPRLLLSKQWAKVLIGLIEHSGMKFAFVNVNSSNFSGDMVSRLSKAQFAVYGAGSPDVKSTTNPEELQREVRFLNNRGFHVIIFSTYHSSHAVMNSNVEIDAAFYDECHYLVSSGERNNFRDSLEVNAKKKIFMTATPKLTDSDEGVGMNNPEVFGQVVYEKKPAEIIDAGAIVCPRLHVIGCEEELEERDWNSRSVLIDQAFNFHKDHIKKESFDASKLGAKMLIVCDGQMAMEGILRAVPFQDFQNRNPDVKIFALSSNYGVLIDGVHHNPPVNDESKEKLLSALNNLQDNDDAIIFHVDMIAEGLDVPGLTGILPFRNCGKIKFLQNTGRAMRLHEFDKDRIFGTETLKVGDWENYVKANCYVIIPYVLENREDFMFSKMVIIDAMRHEYGFDPSENCVIDFIHPDQEDNAFKDDAIRRQIRAAVVDTVEEYYNTIEQMAADAESNVCNHYIRRYTDNQAMQFIDMIAGKDPHIGHIAEGR